MAKVAGPALVIALSPVPVVLVLVLLVHNDRPYSSSIAYLLGRSISLAGLTTAVIHIPWLRGSLAGPGPPWADWVVVGIGAGLVALGVRMRWRRPRGIDRRGWESRVGRISPMIAVAMGALPLLANPKALAASAAAGAGIASLHVTVPGTVTAVALYAALANSTVVAPLVAYLAVGPRIDPQLERIRGWIQARREAVTMLTLLLVGGLLMLYGFA